MHTNKSHLRKITNLPNPQYYTSQYNNDTYQYNILFISKFKRIRPDVQQRSISITEENKEEIFLALQRVNGSTKTVEKLIGNLFNVTGVKLQIIIRDKSYYLVAKNAQLGKSIIIKILHTDKHNYVYSSMDRHSGETSKTYSLQPIEYENLDQFKRFDKKRIIYVQGKKDVYKAIENEIGIVINEVGIQQQYKPNINPDVHSSKPTTKILNSSVRNSLTQDNQNIKKGDVKKMGPIEESIDQSLSVESSNDTNEEINETSGEVPVKNAIVESTTNDTTERKTNTDKKKRLEKNIAFLETLNQSALNNTLSKQDIQHISNKFSSYDYKVLYEKYTPLICNTLSNNQVADHDLEIETKKMFFCLLIDSKLYYLQANARDKSQDMLNSYYDKYLESFKAFIDWSQSKDKLPITSLFKELRKNRLKNKESTKELTTASKLGSTNNIQPLDGDKATASPLGDSQSDLEDIIRRVQDSVNIINSLKKRMQDLQSEIEERQGTIAKARNGIAESEAIIKDAQNNIKMLNQQISTQNEKMKASVNSLESTKQSYDKMTSFINNLKTIIGERDE